VIWRRTDRWYPSHRGSGSNLGRNAVFHGRFDREKVFTRRRGVMAPRVYRARYDAEFSYTAVFKSLYRWSEMLFLNLCLHLLSKLTSQVGLWRMPVWYEGRFLFSMVTDRTEKKKNLPNDERVCTPSILHGKNGHRAQTLRCVAEHNSKQV
jgi:hypothetical protein